MNALERLYVQCVNKIDDYLEYMYRSCDSVDKLIIKLLDLIAKSEPNVNEIELYSECRELTVLEKVYSETLKEIKEYLNERADVEHDIEGVREEVMAFIEVMTEKMKEMQ